MSLSDRRNTHIRETFSATLVGLVCVLIVWGWQRYESKRFSIEQTSSADYHTPITSTNVFFSTRAVTDMHNTHVNIAYRFLDDQPQPFWLKLGMTNYAPPMSRLVYHPDLAKLDWPQLQRQELTLFQREDTYDSIQEFLDNPPDLDTLLIEEDLAKYPAYSQLQASTFASERLNLEKIDFILTTFRHPDIRDSSLYYQTVLNAASARINENDNLSWHLFAPEVSPDHSIEVTNLHIDYIQSN